MLFLRGTILLALAANLVLALILGSRGAYACSCAAPPPDPQRDLRSSDAVFYGTVSKAGEAPPDKVGSPEPNVPVEFVVDGAWKGVSEGKVVVLGGDGANCGFVFDRGRRYLVYAESARGERDAERQSLRTHEAPRRGPDRPRRARSSRHRVRGFRGVAPHGRSSAGADLARRASLPGRPDPAARKQA